MPLHSEITEQPDRIKSLLFSQRKTIERVAAAIQKRDIQYVFLSARGTSNNVGRYANYLLGTMNGLPLALATVATFLFVGLWNSLLTLLMYLQTVELYTLPSVSSSKALSSLV